MGVRRTATRLNLGSEASKRFEKSQPRCHMQQAIARFVHLLDDAGHDFEVVSRLSCAQPQPEAPRTIDLPVGQLRRRMGIELPVEHAEAILTSLEFQVEHLQGEGEGDGRLRVTPPPHRTPRDQALPEDLIEEIARVYGYDNIAPSMPAVTMAPQPLDRRRRAERAIRQFLSSACGRREVHTYSWYDDAFLHRIEFNPGATLTLRNPSAPETARMRTSMLPNLLQVAAQNEVHEDDIAIYELGRTYRPVGESDRDERTVLGVVDAAIPRAASLESLFARLKGQALELLELLTADPGAVKTEQVDADASRPWETPGAVLAIKPAGAADLTLGKLGYASSSTKRWFRQGTRVAWMELDIDLVLKHLQPITPRYQPPPVHPGSWMDFSLLWPTDRRFAELEAIVTGFAHPLRRGVRYLTSYRGKELKGQASHSFRFQLQAESGTLSGDQIQGFRDDFIAYLKGHGVALR